MSRVTKKEVASKRIQGGDWIVVQYYPDYGWVESHPMNYWAACASVKRARERWDTKSQSYKEGESQRF